MSVTIDPDERAEPVTVAGRAAADLRERFDELAAIEARITELGEERVETAADAYRQALRVLDQYEEDAVGTGDFGSYVQFESAFASATSTGEDALASEAFERASEAVDKRRLSEADFETAREALEPAGEYVDLLERRDEAIERYRSARHDAIETKKTLEAHLADLERIAGMADADLDAPVERIREPIETYNERIRETFRSFKRSASARETIDFLDRADGSAFVDIDSPPADLREYVEEHADDESLTDLLEYADYSQSKLEHYVDDPGALRTMVAIHRTYIERLDGEPLTLAWPPKVGDELTYVVDELIPIVSRIADDDVVALLREARDIAREDDYERLRRAAEVRDALDDDELALLESGDIDARFADANAVLEVVEDVLEETER